MILKQKKSQVYLETIAVLIVFIVIIAFGMMFYAKVARRGVQISIKKATSEDATKIAKMVSLMPEVTCSNRGVEKPNCYDIYKLISMYNITENNKDYYYDLLKYSDISVVIVYPDDFEDNEITLYNNMLPDYKSMIETFFPVSIYNITSNEFYFGYLDVKVYS